MKRFLLFFFACFWTGFFVSSGFLAAQELHPPMRPDFETRKEWAARYEAAPRAYIDPRLKLLRGELSLLDHISYIPEERDQGFCGNCWAWAGTGCLEVAHDLQEGIKERLSVQYINSCALWLIGKECCDGGFLEDFTDFYNITGRAYPWSNTNADWESSMDYYARCQPSWCGTISGWPRYGITAVTAETVETHGVGQTTAIANIKNVLNQGKAVWFGFYLPTEADWKEFVDDPDEGGGFWLGEFEDDVFNTDYSCGHNWNNGAAHAVLCVGYNDDEPGNSYWIMLNSWGTAKDFDGSIGEWIIHRPHGLFRLDMNINYDCYFVDSGFSFYSLYWQTLDVTFGPPPAPTPTPAPPGPISGRVYDKDTGAGIRGVHVSASGREGTGSDETDSQGRYRISGLELGTYLMFANTYTGSGIREYPSQFYNQTYHSGGATWVWDTYPGISGIDFPIPRGGVITGRVIDGCTGQGVPDITITAYDFAISEAGEIIEHGVCHTRSDRNGTYLLKPLFTGEHKLFATAYFHNSQYPTCFRESVWFDRKHKISYADQVSVTLGQTSAAPDWPLIRCGTITPTPLPTPSPRIINPGEIVINEVAWMGTLDSASDEWMEFYNTTDEIIDIASCSISGAGGPEGYMNFSGPKNPGPDGKTTTNVPAKGFLVYANDQDVFSDGAEAHIWDATMDMSDGGKKLTLYNGLGMSGPVIDEVDCSGGWFAGEGSGDKNSMEKKDPSHYKSNDPTNWGDFDPNALIPYAYGWNGCLIYGSPDHENSIYVQPGPSPPPTATPTVAITPTPSPTPTSTPPGKVEIWQVWAGIPGPGQWGDGAGQATLILAYDSNNNLTRSILYDCGSAVYSAHPYDLARETLYLMDHLGLEQGDLDYLIISHYDWDHYMGTKWLIDGTGLPEDSAYPLVHDGIGQPGVAYDRGGLFRAEAPWDIEADYLNAVSGVRQTWTAGSEIDLGITGADARLRCLARGNTDFAPFDADRIYVYGRPDITSGKIDENAKSIVSLLSYGGFDMYIGGDSTSYQGGFADVEGVVAEVINDDLERRVDILLVDHHGSLNHTSYDFLELICPSLAWIAVWDQSYDFPRPEVLSRLENSVECTAGGQAIMQVSPGDRNSLICGFVALGHIHASADGNFYTVDTTDVPGRTDYLQPVTNPDWTDHPVSRDPCATPVPPPPPPGDVVMNEIAWMGTKANTSSEWIELYNRSASTVTLDSWTLASYDGSPNITLSGTILGNSYFLLESKENCITDIPADQVASFWPGLSNDGEWLQLKDDRGYLMDEVNCMGGWYGGFASPNYETMERVTPEWDGNYRRAWGTWNGTTWVGHDADGNSINGTPRMKNSVFRLITGMPAMLFIDSGDYDGDGQADPAIFRSSSGLWVIKDLTRLYFGQNGDIPVSGDYDGDGASDIALFRPAKGLWAIRNQERFYLGGRGDIPVPRDYDNDGRTDPAIFRPRSACWVIRDIDRAYFGTEGDIPVPADYEGSGFNQIAVYQPSSGLWAIQEMSRIYFGRLGDVPLPADYDGDGVADAAVFRPGNALWAIRNVSRLYFGARGDRAVPADFDGDLISDVAIYRAQTGLWGIRESGKGQIEYHFGSESDLPVTR